ncbi:nucleoside-diphosphate sugar epimerase/dehydratase, partial [Romboutsia timonensis]|uniref:nucleoside-diphosphate sugar epimerase/dehydratase n=1 Tax=Romboutsia timonensis TaxID=1776391 RepID=UPI002F3E3196
MVLNFLKSSINDELDTYKIRQRILLIIDILIAVSSYSISIMLTMTQIEDIKIIIPLFIYIIANVISIGIFKGYSSLWNKSVDREFVQMVIATSIYQVPVAIIIKSIGYDFSLVFYVVNTLLALLSTCTSRIGYRVIRKITMYMSLQTYTDAKKVLIIGAGSAGRLIIKELYENQQLQKKPIGIIDDNKNKLGKKIHNIPVIGTCEDIKSIAKDYEVDEIIFSIANIENKRKKEIIEICKSCKCVVKTIPGIYEIIEGKVDIKNIRDVEIEDLLGRETININTKEISNYLENKTILVTGGGGSIGSELCRQIAKVNPKKLIILDIYENNAYEIQQELIRKYKDKLNLDVIVGSIRDENRLDSIFAKYKPEVVFHAAAHKHVPLMEKSPCEAIKNNVFGTKNVALMADKYKVKRFVLISTDKAVNPTNIMGATKRCAEMIIQTMNEKSKTEFVAVRFGNVLGSNGSVIPLFKKQIEEGGPITVTHPEVTRFFMTIPEAVSLV